MTLCYTLRDLHLRSDVEKPKVRIEDLFDHNTKLGRALREPLLHFVLLAGLLFLADHLFTRAQRKEIVVDQQSIDFLIKQREDLALRPLSPEERQETVDTFIEDEILYREAYERGLDRGDTRMRRNLILKMRGLLAGEIGEPTQEELHAWYDENIDRFVRPPYMTLRQVFFSNSDAVPATLLDRLNDGLDPETVGKNRMDAPRTLLRQSPRDVVFRFGAKAARAILAIDDDRWHGPFETPRGIHFVRVADREPSRVLSYEEVQQYIAGEWAMAKNRERVEREVEGLRDNYRIVISGEVGSE